jgi:hypothetical protein
MYTVLTSMGHAVTLAMILGYLSLLPGRSCHDFFAIKVKLRTGYARHFLFTPYSNKSLADSGDLPTMRSRAGHKTVGFATV